jgi:thioredoxin-dependent peroxiredoxin
MTKKTKKQWLVVSLVAAGMSAPVVAGTQTPAPAAPAVELKVGDPAPAFSLPGTDGKTHTLAQYKGKAVVIAWYPAAFTSGCTAECKSFAENGPVLKQFDVAYFMASVDTPEKNKAFAEQEKADFPLLSDPDKTVATAYGVLNARGTANRWTFYIGPDGRIAYIEKQVNAQTAGPQLAAKLTELGVKKK